MTTASGDAAQRAALRVTGGLVAQIAARLLTIPVAIAVSAVLARSLGAPDFGAIYLANTALSVVFLFVDFGTGSQMAAMVARDPASTPGVLGAGLALRAVLGAVALLLIDPLTRVFGYSETVRMVFMLTAVRCLLNSMSSCMASIVRGLELIPAHARLTVITTVAEAAILVPTMLLGGGLHAAMLALVASAVLGMVVWGALLLRIGAAKIGFAAAQLRELLHGGTGFLVFDLALRLQPYIDANFLEKLSTPTEVGWYAAAQRMTGSLLLPVSTLNFAIYPAMARLWRTDRPAFVRLTRSALRAAMLFGIMAAVGAACFAEPVISAVYGRTGFSGAARDLQILSVYVGLVFVTMLLGCAIMAAERQLAWAAVQALCIPLSLVLDPILIRWFAAHAGSGGLGVCVSVAVAETLMIAGALIVMPRRILGRSLLLDGARGVAAGAAMAACALLLKPWPVLGMPASVAVYLAIQFALGGFDAAFIAQIRTMVASRLRRGATGIPPAPGTA